MRGARHQDAGARVLQHLQIAACRVGGIQRHETSARLQYTQHRGDEARSLLEQDLLDELMLVVYPILVGRGRRLLNEGESLKRLKLVSSKSTRTGAVILTYQPFHH